MNLWKKSSWKRCDQRQMVWVHSISQIVAQRSQFGIICNRWGDKWHQALITQACCCESGRWSVKGGCSSSCSLSDGSDLLTECESHSSCCWINMVSLQTQLATCVNGVNLLGFYIYTGYVKVAIQYQKQYKTKLITPTTFLLLLLLKEGSYAH